MNGTKRSLTWVAALCAAGPAQLSMAQTVQPGSADPRSWNLIVPQTRCYQYTAGGSVELVSVDAKVTILEQVATTQLDITLHNPSNQRLEAKLLVPVPDKAAVRGFSFQGAAAEPKAELLPRDEARRTYDGIVAKLRDPALLEFAGYNLIRSSLFPVEPGQDQKVRLVYEHILPAEGNRVDYVLPRSESLSYNVPWNVSVEVKTKAKISTLYSPSHPIDTTSVSEHASTATISPRAVRNPGPFRLSYLTEAGAVTASLFAYPEPVEDPGTTTGQFLLLAGLPAKLAEADKSAALKREVTLVLDKSGSMQGQKFEQARESALQILSGLSMGESFRIVVYSDQVESFSPAPVVKSPETMEQARGYIKAINVNGGTNLHDALAEALRPAPAEGTLPLVLFLTDGLPTVGETTETAIRNVAIKMNPHHRRVFTFGVGFDVNTPLLERIADETRARTTIVLPDENVEVKVGQVFRRLSGPVLADAKLETVFPQGSDPRSRVTDMIPATLPDMFEGDQLTLLGRYSHYESDGPVTFRISGNFLGTPRVFEFSFDFKNATTRNAFVPRLWASRKIGILIDAIRQLGADTSAAFAAAQAGTDPKLKELVDEIVRLSTEYGILTEYTAFLAREGTDFAQRDKVMAEAADNLVERGMAVRSGAGAVNQTANATNMKWQGCLNADNNYLDAGLNSVSVTGVQQVCDRAFYNRGSRWVDSRLLEKEKTIKPDRTVEFGTDEYRKLADRLTGEGRQGIISLSGEILLLVDGEHVLIRGPQPAASASAK